MSRRPPKGPNRAKLGEKGVAQEILRDFNPEGSKGMMLIEKIMGKSIKKIRFNALESMGRILAAICDIALPRDYKRSKPVLIKWFDMNSEIIEPQIPIISILY